MAAKVGLLSQGDFLEITKLSASQDNRLFVEQPFAKNDKLFVFQRRREVFHRLLQQLTVLVSFHWKCN